MQTQKNTETRNSPNIQVVPLLVLLPAVGIILPYYYFVAVLS